MRQRIITATIRRCAFAICKAAADVVLAADRCAMRMSGHLFSARHGFASPSSHSHKRLTGAVRGDSGRLQTATSTYRPAISNRSANTAAWRVRPMQVVRVVAPVALG
jgi:hypothetical protein